MQDIMLINKITMKSIKTQPGKMATEKGAPIANVYGFISGSKTVVDKVRGESFNALVGQFEAENLDTGERFQSGVLYLPKGIHETLESIASKLTQESDSVKFAIQVYAVTASNPIGYSYSAKNLFAPAGVDPLDELRAAMPTQKSLPAPVEAKKK